MPSAKKGATKAPWEMIDVQLAKLHLDLQNYRHDEAATEDAAIAQLYTHEKVEALAKDIAEQGTLSPLDLIGVVPMPGNPGHFVAVEGNRRLCALLLLKDSDRAPTTESRAVMNKLAKQVQLPKTISVVCFTSKAVAKHWIDVRHLGPQEGQGLRAWNATAKDRAADDGGPNKLAVAVLDRARDGKWLAEGATPSVTTLTRYLKNREVRAALGLGHHRDLVFTHNQEEVDDALKQFLRDALPTGDGRQPPVHSRSNDGDRAAYARELRDRGVAPKTTLRVPVVPAPAAPSSGVKGRTRNKPDPAGRRTLVPTDFVCKTTDHNLRMLFKEMQRTPIDEHEFASAYLLRAFAERVMTLFMKKVEPGFNAANDQALVTRCVQKLDPEGKLPKFKALRNAASDKDSSHSLHTLGAAVHAGLLKDRRALVMAWRNWEDTLKHMLEATNP